MDVWHKALNAKDIYNKIIQAKDVTLEVCHFGKASRTKPTDEAWAVPVRRQYAHRIPICPGNYTIRSKQLRTNHVMKPLSALDQRACTNATQHAQNNSAQSIVGVMESSTA
ncbi:Hypothetical predicted protein [Octopus vulgaris]|uniref:Uncharacterized protein n=1 Tax=Octopus vulgaris TaxID=6645 RepID=A0AA36F4V9_OCTVU|nr:Hypothetical predicted protein [Octopus vulgaris]